MGQGRGGGGTIVEEALLMGFEEAFRVWGPGGGPQQKFVRVLEDLHHSCMIFEGP